MRGLLYKFVHTPREFTSSPTVFGTPKNAGASSSRSKVRPPYTACDRRDSPLPVVRPGPGDHLSETQKVWIAVLLEANIEVEVLWVMTEGEKEALDDKAKERKEKAESKKRARAGSDDEEED